MEMMSNDTGTRAWFRQDRQLMNGYLHQRMITKAASMLVCNSQNPFNLGISTLCVPTTEILSKVFLT